MVIFVGDKPANRMRPGALAFEGAVCTNRLAAWIKILTPGNYFLINSHSFPDQSKLQTFNRCGDVFVALGNNASNVLCGLDIPHFKLPHPSGLNRQTNDISYVVSRLNACKKYLQGTKVLTN